MPKISIIMACYNTGSFVSTAIHSVLDQSFTDYELIVVDDCSSDDSLQKIGVLASGNARIKVFSTKRQSGPGAARNLAINHANGDWLAVLDADDTWLPDKLMEQHREILVAPSNTVLIGAGSYHIDPLGNRIASFAYPSHSSTLKRNLYTGKRFPPHSSMVYRASALQETGGFNERFIRAQDYELWLRLSDIGEFRCCQAPLIEYRLHETNITAQRSKQGYSQNEYGTAARVCHMLRHAGYNDPGTDADPQQWERFMAHVAEVIHQSDYFAYLEWKTGWKQAMQGSRGIFPRLLHSLRAMLRSPSFFIAFLRSQALGSNLPKKCFKSWVSKQRTST